MSVTVEAGHDSVNGVKRLRSGRLRKTGKREKGGGRYMSLGDGNVPLGRSRKRDLRRQKRRTNQHEHAFASGYPLFGPSGHVRAYLVHAVVQPCWFSLPRSSRIPGLIPMCPLYLPPSPIKVCDTEEAYSFEMNRIGKIFDLDIPQVKSRCAAIAEPFYGKASYIPYRSNFFVY